VISHGGQRQERGPEDRPVGGLFAIANTPVPAIINQVNANGTVGLMTLPTTGPAQQSSVPFNPNQGANSWSYFDFF
jgi:hypothetical protein